MNILESFSELCICVVQLSFPDRACLQIVSALHKDGEHMCCAVVMPHITVYAAAPKIHSDWYDFGTDGMTFRPHKMEVTYTPFGCHRI